jgi:hypothetical protein
VNALQLFAAEFAITITNDDVWLSIGLALLLGAGCLVFGTWVTRTVGLLRSDAPAGETLGVGLASGLMILAAWWAAIWSGGRSSFTPVAIGFVIAIGLVLIRRAWRPAASAEAVASEAVNGGEEAASRRSRRRSLVLTALAGGVFVVAVALLYGSTMAPSPRDGVQPVEFTDEAFYAILGRDLAATGIESVLPASGFSELPGLPAQTWYHWAELWLASAVITIFGTAPIAARYFVVLPIVLLAAAALTGTLVRCIGKTDSRRAFLFGFVACLFLAPVPLPGTFFSSWPVGLIFGIGFYGLAAVAVLLALYCLVLLGTRAPTWALASFVGSAIAFILPAHVVIALLGLIGIGSVWAIRVAQSVNSTHRLPVVPPVWRRTFIATVVALVATMIWGSLTGHGLGGGASSPNVLPFNVAWQFSVAFVYLGAGTMLAIPVAALLLRREAPIPAAICFGAVALLVVGAIAWGARLADFNMYHVFFGGIAVFATPVAAVAAWMLFERLREGRHLRMAIGVLILCVGQFGVGVVNGFLRLQEFGPRGDFQPIPISLIELIRELPPDAKLAYACRQFDEVSFANPRLLGIDAHTGRRVVPMCFEAEVFSAQNGVPVSMQVPNASMLWAPQRLLYPDASAEPSSAAIAAFLKDHGVGYIYVDAIHPNSLVDDAVPIAASGDGAVLRLP